MAEPASSFSAMTVWLMAAGVMGAFLGAVGITWPVLFFAACGTFMGVGGTRQDGRWRAMLAFAITVVLAAKAGAVGAAYLGKIGGVTGDQLAQALAAFAGLMFHPLLSLAAGRIKAATPQAGAPADHTQTEATQ